MGGVPTLTRKGDQAPSLPRLEIAGERVSAGERRSMATSHTGVGWIYHQDFSLTIHHLVQRQRALDRLALERILFSKYNPVKPYVDARITEMIRVF